MVSRGFGWRNQNATLGLETNHSIRHLLRPRYAAKVRTTWSNAPALGRRCLAWRRALDAIGDWWSLLIVRDVFDGAARGEFLVVLGVARTSSIRLRTLVVRIELAAALAWTQPTRRKVLTEKARRCFPSSSACANGRRPRHGLATTPTAWSTVKRAGQQRLGDPRPGRRRVLAPDERCAASALIAPRDLGDTPCHWPTWRSSAAPDEAVVACGHSPGQRGRRIAAEAPT